MDFPSALALVVQSVAVPYGYTLSVWSARALAIVRYGIPRMRHVLLFVVGAMAAYLVLDIPVVGATAVGTRLSPQLPSVALLNLFPLSSAVIAALLVRRIENRAVGFFASSFVVTLVYVLSLSLLIVKFA